MTEDALLSELCAICHLNRPKYKCPRCTIQTCSLACVRRHKLWSQCSGSRDPAAYRKRHELATPSSVDQDYNFISRVERRLRRAGDDVQERGIALNDNRRKRVKGEARRDEEIQERGAIVMKAPSGMSRALQNKSKWDYRHKCVMWTVEWVLENGDKVYGNCQESRTITEAFDNAIGSRKMRKLQSRPSDAKSSTQIPDCGHSERQERKEIPLGSAAAAGSASSSPLHFYLHRPNLPSNVKCLIPLQPDAPVKEVIRNRVLIEFPTIFVLNVSEEHLSTPFVTEENYLKQQTEMPTTCGSETNELPESETKKPPVTFNDHPPELDAHEVPFGVDEQQVIEVLQRDLGT